MRGYFGQFSLLPTSLNLGQISNSVSKNVSPRDLYIVTLIAYEIGNLVVQSFLSILIFLFLLLFQLYRFGYKDKVKQTGALPRLSEDAPKLENQVIYEPEAQFAPCRALAGQNDYIDILGKFLQITVLYLTIQYYKNSLLSQFMIFVRESSIHLFNPVTKK